MVVRLRRMVELPYIDYWVGCRLASETTGGDTSQQFSQPYCNGSIFWPVSVYSSQTGSWCRQRPSSSLERTRRATRRMESPEHEMFPLHFLPQCNDHPFVDPSPTFSPDHPFRLGRTSDCVPERSLWRILNHLIPVTFGISKLQQELQASRCCWSCRRLFSQSTEPENVRNPVGTCVFTFPHLVFDQSIHVRDL